MNVYYTYFDRNYAVRAVAMYRSLARCSGPFKMYMLCLDKESHDALLQLDLADVTLVSLDQLEAADPELLAVKQGRSLVEYYFTITSCMGCYVMDREVTHQVLTYLDSDLFFYSSVEPLLRELENASIGVAYQSFPEHGALRQGRYNVGWVSWRRDPQGMACLREYREQCLAWCYLREENGKYADQLYLDEWEKRAGFHVFRSHGANVAPWNIGHYRITYLDGGVQVDGDPLIFFHFHKFSALSDRWFDTNFWRSRMVTVRLRRCLVIPYVKELRSTGLKLPMTGSALRHFPYKTGLGRVARNAVRISLAILRCAYVYSPLRN
ncbi:MAG: hypothetical protein QM790_02525 [Nibricoccus sp.]